jgi:hypothetical protein
LFAAALEEVRKGHELGSKQPGWPYPSARWVQEAERLVELDRKLVAILEDKEKPAGPVERVALARLSQKPFKKLYAAAARFYADAFTAEPKLADDLRVQHRYNAACAAALAAAGKGEDAKDLDDKERARLRQQARDWLAADLALWTKHAGSNDPTVRDAVQKALQHWQSDADLAALRDPEPLANLPDAERDACRKLWDEVEAVRKKAAAKP